MDSKISAELDQLLKQLEQRDPVPTHDEIDLVFEMIAKLKQEFHKIFVERIWYLIMNKTIFRD